MKEVLSFFNLYNRTKRSMPDLFDTLIKDSCVVMCVCGNEYWEDKRVTKTFCPVCKKQGQLAAKVVR